MRPPGLPVKVARRAVAGKLGPVARPSNTEERRAQIADALLTVMAREGYGRATIAAIAREAGLTPGLLHYHFESKREILIHLVERLVERLERRSEARGARAAPGPYGALVALLDAHVELGDDADPRAVAAWVAVGAEAVRDGDVRAIYADALERSLERIARLVGACLRERGKSARGARRIAAGLLSAIEGSFHLGVAAPGLVPEGSAAPMLRLMLDHALAASDGA